MNLSACIIKIVIPGILFQVQYQGWLAFTPQGVQRSSVSYVNLCKNCSNKITCYLFRASKGMLHFLIWEWKELEQGGRELSYRLTNRIFIRSWMKEVWKESIVELLSCFIRSSSHNYFIFKPAENIKFQGNKHLLGRFVHQRPQDDLTATPCSLSRVSFLPNCICSPFPFHTPEPGSSSREWLNNQ